MLKKIKRTDKNAIPVALAKTKSGVEILYDDGIIDRHLIPEIVQFEDLLRIIKTRKLVHNDGAWYQPEW